MRTTPDPSLHLPVPNATVGGQPPSAAAPQQQQPIPTGPNTSPTDKLISDLSMTELNDIHHHLWIAGSHGNISPLHHQRVLLRTIIPSEQARLHLVWYDRIIYIKPLPDCTIIRTRNNNDDYSSDEKTTDPSGSVSGFLRSYCALIRYPVDLAIAQDLHLVSRAVGWDAWLAWREDVLADTDGHVNKRYQYGELRLHRLDLIYRFTCRGLTYFTVHRTYETYFAQYFSLFAAAFAFVAIVLAAMQVLVAIPALLAAQGTGIAVVPEFVMVTSYRFCVAVLMGTCLCFGYVVTVFFLMFFYNLVLARFAQRGETSSTSEAP